MSRFGASLKPSAMIWLFDRQKSITFWHVEATGLDLSSGEGFALPPWNNYTASAELSSPVLGTRLRRICSKLRTTTRYAKGRYKLQCRA